MRRSLIALAAAALTSGIAAGPASAQSSNGQNNGFPAADSSWSSWLGTYAGVFAGGAGLASSDNNGIDGLTATASYKSWGGMGGALIGYNFSAGQVLLGVEGDLSYLGASASGQTYPFVYGGAGGLVDKMEVDWMGSLRARVGLPMGQFMPFVTGGVAVAGVTLKNVYPSFPNATQTRSETEVGWTAGGGVDMLISRNMSIRAEYLHTDFGDVKMNGNQNPAGAPPLFNRRAEPTIDVVRGALVFKF